MGDSISHSKIDELNTTIENLLEKIKTQEIDLTKKNKEINDHLDKIENLEDTIMNLESLIPEDTEDNKKKKKKSSNPKLIYELHEREKEIRELKNRMGFLRKEKVGFQQELEKIKKKTLGSTVIRTEELRGKTPLDVLVKELQDKVNKQKTVIVNLKRQYINKNEFNIKLKEKGEVLERQMAFSLQKIIDDQRKMIELKEKEIEKLKKDVDEMKGKFELLEVQINIRNQKIEQLSGKKAKKKRK